MSEAEPPSDFVGLTWRRPAELQPLVDALEEAGVRYVLADDSQVRMEGRGGLGQFSGLYVFVHRNDLERAREIEQRQLRETLPDLPEEDAAQDGGCPAVGCNGAPYALTIGRSTNVYPGANFQYLAANVIDTDTNNPLLPAYRIVNTSTGEKIAFIGETLQGTPLIVTPTGVAGLDFLDEADTVNALIPRLKQRGVEFSGPPKKNSRDS